MIENDDLIRVKTQVFLVFIHQDRSTITELRLFLIKFRGPNNGTFPLCCKCPYYRIICSCDPTIYIDGNDHDHLADNVCHGLIGETSTKISTKKNSLN